MPVILNSILTACMLLVITLTSSAQSNLVDNPGFEDTIAFQNPGYLQNMVPPWFRVQITPDYISSIYSASKPLSDTGTGPCKNSIPHTGIGCVGEFMYDNHMDIHEYLGGKLKTPLHAGNRYCLRFYYLRALWKSPYLDYSMDGLGVYFTPDSIVEDLGAYFALPYTPQIENPSGSILYDSVWAPFTGSFVAQGGERYFIVGNFKSKDETLVYPQPGPDISIYYFFDDFSVTECATKASYDDDSLQITSPLHFIPDSILHGKHPLIIPTLISTGNAWQFIHLQPQTTVTLYNVLGQLLYQSLNYQNDFDASTLAAGIYLYVVTPPNGKEQKGKLVVIK